MSNPLIQDPAPTRGNVIFPADVPGRVPLGAYSTDSERVYAADRDRLSREYRRHTAAVLVAAARFDAFGGTTDPELLPALEEGLAGLRSVGAQLRDLAPPSSRPEFSAEHAAFAGALDVRVSLTSKSLEAAREHVETIEMQLKRKRILKENKEAGMPWHRGLEEAGLLVASDTKLLGDDYFKGLSPTHKALEKFRLRQREERMDKVPSFSLLTTIAESVVNAKPDEMNELAQRMMRNG